MNLLMGLLISVQGCSVVVGTEYVSAKVQSGVIIELSTTSDKHNATCFFSPSDAVKQIKRGN